MLYNLVFFFLSACKIGFFGVNCSMTCPNGTFGKDCQSICSCYPCHHADGCTKGYMLAGPSIYCSQIEINFEERSLFKYL